VTGQTDISYMPSSAMSWCLAVRRGDAASTGSGTQAHSVRAEHGALATAHDFAERLAISDVHLNEVQVNMGRKSLALLNLIIH
jgi:hypothetical protein